MSVSVAIYDPGGWSDSFCDLMATVTREKILLTDAVFWNKEKFPNLTMRQVKDDIEKLNNHFHFDYHLCETNNQGHMVISDLRKEYGIPVIGITTSGELKRKGTIQRGTSLDKDKTVPWVMKLIEDGIIELPKRMTPGLKEGMEQIKNYGVSKSGKYQALSGHDDFVSCLVILVHWAKRHMLKGMARKLIGVGGGDPGMESQKSAYDIALESMRNRFEKAGMSPDNFDIKFPD
ncbi:MAG: hypothetical protein K5785_00920 [Nitrosarchaeum sp.]|nr:hypothetical protein [Nitrosarchaeum sp.]